MKNNNALAARYIANLILRVFFIDLHVVGYKPDVHDKKMLYVSKAVHPLEKFILFAGLPGTCSLVMRNDLYDKFLNRHMFKILGMIKERNRNDVFSTMDAVSEMLEERSVLCFLNEISYSVYEKKEGRDSISWINENKGVPIVPVSLTMDKGMIGENKFFKKPGPSYLFIGKPINDWSKIADTPAGIYDALLNLCNSGEFE